MFIVYWLFNTYIFPKPQPKAIAHNAQTEQQAETIKVRKPEINVTSAGILIYSDNRDAELRYNFDGQEPTKEDMLYTDVIAYNPEEIDISKLRVKAFINEDSSSTAFYTKNVTASEIIQSGDINDVILENEYLKLVFSPKDAVITQAFLKKYPLTQNGIVNLIPENTVIGKIDLRKGTVNNLIYFSEVNGNSVKFFIKDIDDNQIFSKEYILGEDYTISMNIDFLNEAYQEDYSISFNGIADTENLISKDKNPEKYFKGKLQDYKFIALDNNEISSYALSKLKKGNFNSETSYVQWAAIRSKYFVMSLFANEINADRTFNTRMENESPAFVLDIKNPSYETSEHNYKMYFGPVDQEFVGKFDSSLIFDRVVERSWTWLHWLAKLFELAFKYLSKVIPNYGLVLIVFAILIKLLLYPLTHKSFENSMKMQKIQPMLTAIQKKYKSDPMKMQQEMSKIKKEHGVSTLGGCIPMIIQMPIFFSLYPTLRYSIALRGAFFFGWLQDLSIPDPYYVLPILMGIFMFIQQKMMTARQNTSNVEMDEKQEAMMQSQKMMAYVMPVMMFFIFRNLPAGLTLYWTVFNILSIVQQYIINKKFRG
jgi:YidC/Oxa1 family membrane protein insertase